MREYEIYVPLFSDDGNAIPPEQVNQLRVQLVDRFGGLTHFPQENDGLWKVGSTTFRDRIVILRVLASDAKSSEEYLAKLKTDLQKEWHQESVLIIARDVQAI